MDNEAAADLVRIFRASLKEQKLTNSLLVGLLKEAGVKPPATKTKPPTSVAVKKAIPKPAVKPSGRYW